MKIAGTKVRPISHDRIKKFTRVVTFSIFILFLVFTTSEMIKSNNNSSIEDMNSAEYYPTQGSESIELYFFYNPGCESCIIANNTINSFIALNPELAYIPVKIYIGNATADQFGRDFFGVQIVPYPSAVFVINTCHYALLHDYITVSNLQAVYEQLISNPDYCQGWIYFEDFNLWVAFFSGFISGLSPCVILITGFFGTALFSTQNKKMFLMSMSLFILGVLSAYFLLGLLFTYFVQFAVGFFSSLLIKLLIGIPLLGLGSWYIIDSFNEKSKLFNTPDKLKKFFSRLSLERSSFSSFILGFVFTILKSPCVAGVMLSLLFSIFSTGFNTMLAVPVLLIFGLGVALPIFIVFIALRLGVKNQKIDEKRLKYRPYLRIVSGILIIITTLFSIL